MSSRRRRRHTADNCNSYQDGYRERADVPYCHHDKYTAGPRRVPSEPCLRTRDRYACGNVPARRVEQAMAIRTRTCSTWRVMPPSERTVTRASTISGQPLTAPAKDESAAAGARMDVANKAENSAADHAGSPHAGRYIAARSLGVPQCHPTAHSRPLTGSAAAVIDALSGIDQLLHREVRCVPDQNVALVSIDPADDELAGRFGQPDLSGLVAHGHCDRLAMALA